MRVKCLNNQYKSLPSSITNEMRPATFSVDIGNKYTVYAISEFYNNIWFFILDRDLQFMWIPSLFFETIDPRLSRFWIFSLFENWEDKKIPFFGIPPWAKDIEFYDNFVEGEEKEINLLRQYQKSMDLEFPDESITESAQIGDETWLICPKCIDAWEYPDCQDALVICPSCVQKYNNPRYDCQKNNSVR